MPADLPRPARDDVVERLERDAAYLTAEPQYEVIEGGKRCAADIRTILARLAQAERDRDDAVALKDVAVAAARDVQRRADEAIRDTAILAQEIEHLRADSHAATVRAKEAERLASERLAVIRGLEFSAYPAHGSGFIAVLTAGGDALQAALTADAEGTGGG